MRRPSTTVKRSRAMSWIDLLLPLGIVGLWFLLQAVILPKLGVPT